VNNDHAGPTEDVPRSERGFVTIWLLGLCVALLFLGGLSLDLWRAFTERRALASIADAAALAGASGIDRARYASAGDVVLDPAAAERLALTAFYNQDRAPGTAEPSIVVTPERITVTVTGAVDYTLLRMFFANDPFVIKVDATAAAYRSL
jgi:Flp pilus assembly protein TadG